MEEDSHSFPTLHEPQNYSKFTKSLQELKDLCSQLHAAAGYCESTFLNSNHKHLVVENTKEYVCRAVVAVVDHLGSVSANLEQHISDAESDTISQSEAKIDHLNKKLFVCQEYSDKLALAKLTWWVHKPSHNSRYLRPSDSLASSDVLSQNTENEVVTNAVTNKHQNAESGVVTNTVTNKHQNTENGVVKNTVTNKHEFNVNKEVPLVFYTCNIYKSSSQVPDATPEHDKTLVSLSLSALSDSNSVFNQPKPRTLSFQLQEKCTSTRHKLFRKSMTRSEILSIIRRRK